jgi:hypothetical protein
MHLEANRQFHVDTADATGLVTGRNDDGDVPVGTTFTAVRKVRLDGEKHPFTRIDLGVVATVNLCLRGVEWYGRSIDVIPGGHTAGLRLEGEGLETLRAAVLSAEPREYIFLLARVPEVTPR